MRRFKMSPLHHIHCPHTRVKVKKAYYKWCLVAAALVIWLAHMFVPSYEMHAAFLTNVLFALDPTA